MPAFDADHRPAPRGVEAVGLARRTAALAPRIAALASEAERLRRPADEAWAALAEAGYFSQFVPTRHGGMACDLESFIDATLPVSEACASTGWTAAFCAGHNLTMANFPDEAQAEVWSRGRPYAIAPQLSPGATPARVVPVRGGIRLSGRWGWATGITQADWVLAVAPEPADEGPPGMVMALFPAAEASVLDTWYADGMVGTGSNDVEVRDVFVPEHRVLRDMSVLAGKGAAGSSYPEPVYRTPLFTFNAVVAAAAVLGAARGALALFREHAGRRTLKGSGARQADSGPAQVRLGRADSMVAAAEASLRSVARRACDAGGLAPGEGERERIALRARVSFAVDLCRAATRLLADGAGSGVHMLDHPFQRVVRDVAVAGTHVGFDQDVSDELQGRSLLGLEPNCMLF